MFKLLKNKIRIYIYILVILVCCVLIVPEIRMFFQEMGLRWLYMLFLSFFLSFSLTPLCRLAAYRFNIVDRPDIRKSHDTATPLLGGGAVYLSFITAILVNGIYSQRLWAILGAASLLFVIGVKDDAQGVSAFLRLGAQLAACVLVMSFGVVLHVFPVSWGIFSQTGNVMLTILWIIGITNAMNFFDGMDGMAAGLGIIISLFLGITAFQMNRPFAGWIAAAMTGSCLGFLPYNFKPEARAEIFLGDAGSTVIGFITACLAVYGDWAQDNPVVPLISPLLIFWILIFDMIHITIDRIVSGRVHNLREWVEYVGKDHLHHRIENVLGSKKKSVLFIYLLSFCLGTSAVVLRNAGFLEGFLLVVQSVFIVILITILEHRGQTLAKACIQNKDL
ncbi:Decaprenyl-phosphate N-acetylglucosaminephosphotransferase [Desulfonema limicola]|uniref:Decaprenyl-phosphate N-acetylglucosaminephosphotransferase n=1 Tax=Desulfonema limicola TaxID=45656 RepID=A0A975GFM9_9BACT|nr:MraY family glycosyltransferase [Desulfonema limicola]QTA79466.1 Decaprenyl-phosphate N-acetylglucosaminephosphotransferase [Desulfonema limicola]